MASAGRILIMPKGAYKSNTTYQMLDCVSHNGKAWLNKKTCVNIEPSEANSEYWHDLFGGDYVPFGTHNKKYGSYVGNGSASERGIKTGSIGSFMMVWSNRGMGFISPVGGIFSGGTGEVRYIDSYQCHYDSSGQLTLRTDLMLLNEDGITYNYQCL